MIPLLVLACGEGESTTGSGSDTLLITDYDGMTDDNTWVFRDDGDTGIFEESDLLRTRYMGDGVMEFRRGTRWADADTVGQLEFGLSDGLTLNAWSLLGSGAGSYQLSDFDPEDGESFSSSGATCAVSRPIDGIDTWYGLFEDVFVFECAGGGVLEGQYVFARGVGLVKLTLTTGGGLELVAPW